MTHLGADAAAYVDRQLSREREDVVRRHLAECARCRDLVADQEHLKRRMARANGPTATIPPHLATALAAVVSEPVNPDHQRVRRVGGVLAALVGSSAAVLLLAYVLAPPVPTEGDPVRPDFDGYAANFLADAAAQRLEEVSTAQLIGATTFASTPPSSPRSHRPAAAGGHRLNARELEELTANGWPCHEELSGGFARVDGRQLDATGAVALRYDGEHVQLHLIEQAGSLDAVSLDGFSEASLAEQAVWVREGLPTVVAWEADGVVFTIVSDAPAHSLEQVVGDLPGTPARSLGDRIEDGLHHMTELVSPVT